MTAKTMTGLEKVAVLLKNLPTEVVDKVVRHLDPRHAGLLRSELAKLNGHPNLNQELSGILDEAVNMLGDAPGSLKQERSVPAKALAAKAAAAKPAAAKALPVKEPAGTTNVDIRLAGKAEEQGAPAPVRPPMPAPAALDPNADPLEALALLPSDLLASALDSENARTISLLMNCLEIEVAGQIYKRLSPGKRKEVSLRFTEQSAVGEELIKRIAQGVLKKCQTLRESATPASTEQGGREKRMAALLRGLERTERMALLTALEEADAELTGRIKAMLYQFEDILRMENTSVQKVLSEVDVKSLALALYDAPPEIENKILANLSKRAQESLQEEISLTGKVPGPKVRQARETMVEAIQRLDQRGELVLNE